MIFPSIKRHSLEMRGKFTKHMLPNKDGMIEFRIK